MKPHHFLLILILVGLVSCSRAPQQLESGPTLTQSDSLPDNPCETLSSARISAITGLDIVSTNRAPSLAKVVQAQEENREPDPGTICIYETRSDLGAILIMVPPRADRSAAKYWADRAKYFETFPGAARRVEGLGTDAWISGGNALHVLARDDEYFTVSTQMYEPRSGEVVVKVAKAVLDHHHWR